jgi:hypothetical protein
MLKVIEDSAYNVGAVFTTIREKDLGLCRKPPPGSPQLVVVAIDWLSLQPTVSVRLGLADV